MLLTQTVDFQGMRQGGIRLKKEKDIEGIRRAGSLVLETLDMVEEKIRPGIRTNDINKWVHEFTIRNNAIPAPLTYNNFPKSCCVSVNEVICHGIPGDQILQDGDIVNVDVTSVLKAYYADANKTFPVGRPSSDAMRLIEVTRKSLKKGMAMVKPGNTIGDIGWAIQSYAEGAGYSVVREFVGHGVGFQFHEPPHIPHFGKPGTGTPLLPGMVFTIEPMINIGGKELIVLKDNWTVVTKDGSLSAQFEQTLVVTESGYESLTPF
ncbi:MAG: type I methionyl aminopeptidase [Candidatus Electrothrix scaldis]|nr:MAG: type I methionyl aminopeptidase [Candidatus Electrothrix sp. GW3-3]